MAHFYKPYIFLITPNQHELHLVLCVTEVLICKNSENIKQTINL